MATMEEIVKQADLLGYRGEKREEYLKQEFKLLAVCQEKKEEAERQERKEEAEPQAREKKEEADCKERLELEKMKLDAEMKLLQAKIEAGIIKNEPDSSGTRSSDAGAKHLKLPNFQDGRDDLNIWLTGFERFAESNGWSREKWSSLLCVLLTGCALDCYGRLSAEQAKDYDKVKRALMKRYDLTEDGYQSKFRTCKPAHLGIRRTKDKVLSNFYWPGLDGDVTRYCRSCDVCQRTVKKGTVPRVPLEKVPLIDTPFKRVAIDLVGPINPPSEAGHRFILTLVDYTTRFVEAVPLCKINTEFVAEALVDIYSRLGSQKRC
ncbi:gypsy retrotransposon integrase-like protein 1 [Plakobranchus ocellatus]|uniref:Gypsy retrotransposon integrase-like protein 1 n=1 Tax=Plakobranchus ocellatus TaxID=259542 RepID=A0AAV3YYF4_9GAST|nr:gypsy retrotransposon integrase-like protein 1 [Plakobranchus ocellatus]